MLDTNKNSTSISFCSDIYTYKDTMQELIGKHITSVFIGQGESSIKFTSDDISFVFNCDADCCAETWFSEILNLDALTNHTVAEVQELDLPHHHDGNGRQEYDSFYGYLLITDAGHCTIVFRCSSNGYYGGTCSFSVDNGQGIWTDISRLQDWTAYDTTKPVLDSDSKPIPSYYRHLKCQVLR